MLSNMPNIPQLATATLGLNRTIYVKLVYKTVYKTITNVVSLP